MKSSVIFLTIASLTASAQSGERSHHMLGTSGPLTEASGENSEAIARRHMRSLASSLGLKPTDLEAAYLARHYRSEHNGVTHLLFRQRFQGADVLNAEWTVNLDRDGRVLNAGGRLVAEPSDASVPARERALPAARSAVRAVNPAAGQQFEPAESRRPARASNGIRFAAGPLPQDVEGTPVWFSFRGVVRPAWTFVVADTDRIHRYLVTVDDASQEILEQEPLTFFDGPQPPVGMVFERESPQPVPSPGQVVTSAPPVVPRTLQSFQGDPVASPLTWASGSATAGNNAIIGENLLGVDFQPPTPTQAPNGDFSFPLQLGPGTNPLDYRDAANTNLFYWINRAHDLHYQYGFNEAAGNFQADNLGRGGTAGDAIFAYTHFGANTLGRSMIKNAFFSSQSSKDDGGQSEIAMFVSAGSAAAGNFFTDAAYDAGVIVHEYTHGVSERLVRQNYSTFQGGSMGEGWSDFFGLEYTLPAGAPPDGIYPEGQYFDQSWGAGIRTRPYSTSLDINPLTYANLGHVISQPEVHADGEIWMECLWEMRANLIAQFGDAEGRRRARQIVIDGMKLSPPAPSMVDMRDSILLADRVDFQGASQSQIWAGFARRGMGALAYSDGASTTHATSSFDLPSAGALKTYDASVVIGEPLRLVLQSSALSQPSTAVLVKTTSGDAEKVILEQHGSIYVGRINTYRGAVAPSDARLQLVPGDTITISWDGAGGGKAVQVSVPVMPDYVVSTAPQQFEFSGETRVNSGSPARVQMPFLFPYFDSSYGTAELYDSGLVAFDIPITVPCNDSTALRRFIGFSALWANFNVNGTAQPNEGIYSSRGADFITFRWAGEYTPVGASPVPVNFAATLYADGKIRFDYGSGNAVRMPSTTGQCGAPATGLSNGHDTYSLTTYLDDYNNAPSLIFEPPFNATSKPDVKLIVPTPGQHMQDILVLAGTAADGAVGSPALDVFIDGVQRMYLNPRSDGAFYALADLGGMGLKPGDHNLVLRAINNRGATVDFPSPGLTFTMDPGHAYVPTAAIEQPTEGSTVSGIFNVNGYAYGQLKVTAVDTLLDGLIPGITTYGQVRNDICGALSPVPPYCPALGFNTKILSFAGPIPIADGPHALQIRVRDETGRYFFYPDKPIAITVNNGTLAKVVGVLESPLPNATLSGTVTFSGYVYVPGKTVSPVFLMVDGLLSNLAKTGVARPELCAKLPDADACPNIGFTVDYDTRQLLDGPHVFGINVLGDGKSIPSTIFPNVVKGGVNVFVRNH